jgi:primosomal protein N' (replication factor Y)
MRGPSLFKPDEAPPATHAGPFVRIALERGLDHPDGLVYASPGGAATPGIGARVEAPLGRGNTPTAGYVIEVLRDAASAGIDPARIKPMTRALGGGLPPDLVELARWMARYYCCPIGMVFASMTPAAVRKGIGVVKRKMLEPTPDARRIATTTPLPPTAADAWAKLEPIIDNAALWPIDPRDLARSVGATTLGPVNRLVRAGLLQEITREVVRAAWEDQPIYEAPRFDLSDEQQTALDAVESTFDRFAVHLLHGVTGSGKTEVYLAAIEQVLARGESAIVLVPEISLTPQTAGRFLSRFGAQGVAVLHSGLTQAQRNQQWSAVASGAARVIVGARSAIFAPTPGKVGLIVVDEEHDTSYKQDQLPRYHARDVAIKRAQIEGRPVLLGSATPSLESFHNATEGRFTLSTMLTRPGGMRLPRVIVVDLVEERRKRPWTERHVRLLGPTLEGALRKTLADGAQAILLLNRRGFANYICCPDHRCGWVLTCDDCDATMVFHKDRRLERGGTVRCHHCLAEKLLPASCPMCEKKASVFGLGTQRVEEELARELPELIPGDTLLRLDGDTMRAGRDYFHALERFRSGTARVLLGTQMVAKGLDFPGVRLVGVVHADTAINMPDFRAAERTFQLVSQVAGRAGRSGTPGVVIVQTLEPNSPAIRHAARHDYEGFAREELAQRREAALPPTTRMARIVVRDEDYTAASARAADLEAALRAHAATVFARGPMPCPLSRLAGKHRIAIELTAQRASDLQVALTALRNLGLVKSDEATAVDVDPVAML